MCTKPSTPALHADELNKSTKVFNPGNAPVVDLVEDRRIIHFLVLVGASAPPFSSFLLRLS